MSLPTAQQQSQAKWMSQLLFMLASEDEFVRKGHRNQDALLLKIATEANLSILTVDADGIPTYRCGWRIMVREWIALNGQYFSYQPHEASRN